MYGEGGTKPEQLPDALINMVTGRGATTCQSEASLLCSLYTVLARETCVVAITGSVEHSRQ
jgi:hypothetical protein